MQIESIPKFLFLNEESEQMADRRIRMKVDYDTSGDAPKRIVKKKINNSIELTESLPSNDQINHIAYSNKLGLLITCLQNEILITDFNHFEACLTDVENLQNKTKQLKKISGSIKLSQKVYLSPDETRILAVNQKQIIFYDLIKLCQISRGINQHKLRHFIFTDTQSFAGWNFLSQAYIYHKINEKINDPTTFQGIEHCTSVSLILNHIVLCQKINQGDNDAQNSQIVVFNHQGTEQVNKFQLKDFPNPDNYIFQFTKIISLFTIKHQKQGQFSKNDTYGIILAYYDDYEEQPDRRYLNFVKGNLIEKDSQLKIRSFQLFQSPNQDRSFYYNQNNQKCPFEVQVLTSGIMKIILIEKAETVFVVDASLPFQQLNLFSLKPLHTIKLEGGKFFKGVCLMKNMLQKQKIPPVTDSNNICQMICKDYGGQFLSLYFAEKQTQLTVPFPATLLCLGDGRIKRSYSISTSQKVEEDKVQQIKQGISKIGKSSYIQSIQTPIKLQVGSLQLKKKQQQNRPVQKQAETNPQVFKTTQQKQLIPIIQNIVKSNEASNKTQETSLFNNKFSKPNNKEGQQTPKASLFGNIQNKATTLFGSKQNKGSLFDKKEQTKVQIPTAFSAIQQPPSLFSNSQPKEIKQEPKKQKQNKQQKEEPKSLFAGLTIGGNNKGSLFNKMEQQKNQKKTITNQSETKVQPKKLNNLFSSSESTLFSQPKTQVKKQVQQKRIKLQSKIPQDISFKEAQPNIENITLNKVKQVVELDKQKKVEKQLKQISNEKLKDLSKFLGHDSVELIPQPLKSLTEQQVDALLKSFKSVIKVPQKQISKAQLARQKLLKQQHLKGLVDKFEETKNLIKDLRGQNSQFSSKIFSLKNAKNLIQGQSYNKNKQQSLTLQPMNTMLGLMRNYTKRMQFLQKDYEDLSQNLQNKSPNISMLEQQQRKQTVIRKKIQNLEHNLSIINYNKNLVIPEKFGFFNKQLHDEDYEKVLSNLLIKKTQEMFDLSEKTKILIQNIPSSSISKKQSQVHLEKLQSGKASFIFSQTQTKKKGQKGCFKFSLESSSSSQEEISSQVYDEEEHRGPKILIKFKPKPINLTNYTQKISPLFRFDKSQTQTLDQNLLIPAQVLKAGNLGSNNLLQSSVKRSVNFKDKIPLKKNDDDEVRINTIRRVDFSQIQGHSDEQKNQTENESDDEKNMPDFMGRSLSFAPPKMKPLLTEKKETPSNLGQFKMKQTTQKDLTQNSQPKTKQLKEVASIFGNKKIEENKQALNKKTEIKPSVSLFGTAQNKIPTIEVATASKSKEFKPIFPNIPNKLEIGIKKSQQKEEQKIEKNKDNTKQQPVKKQNENTRKQTKQEKPKTLFGSKPLFGSGNTSLNLFGNSTSPSLFNKVAPKEGDKQKEPNQKQKTTADLTKSQSIIPDIKQKPKQQPKKTTLFGDSTANKSNLFGSDTTGFGLNKQEPKQQTSKKTQAQESKPVSIFEKGSSIFTGAQTGGSLFSKNKPAQLQKINQVNQSGIKSVVVNKNLPAQQSDQASSKQNQTGKNQINQVNNQQEVKVNTPVVNQENNLSNLFGNQGKQAQLKTSTGTYSYTQNIAQTHQAPAFGSGNKFLNATSQPTQNTQQQTFNPSMGGFNTGFAPSTGAGLKSFSNFTPQTTNQTLFNNNPQQEQPQTNQPVSMFQKPQNTLFGNQQNQNQNQGQFNQSSTGLFSQPNNGNLFGNNQQTSTFNASSTGFGTGFGGNSLNQPNQSGGNFLSGFSMNSVSTSSKPPVNPSMLQPRK